MGKKNKELAGEPLLLWGGRTHLKCSWGILPAAHVATKSRLWWWQWAMGMLFLQSLTRENDPKERKLTPSIDSPLHFLGTVWKVLKTYHEVSSGCRRRCLRDFLSKLLAACAAPDEQAWGKVRRIPIWRAWTEAERLRCRRLDAKRETEHTLLSPMMC